jgi:hypothetical protein
MSRYVYFLVHAFLPISIGILFAIQERITISESTIESRFLGRKKRLQRQSAKVAKIGSNGFTIVHENATKLFVHKLMQNSDRLLKEIKTGRPGT